MFKEHRLSESYSGEARFGYPETESLDFNGSFDYNPSELPEIKIQGEKLDETGSDQILFGEIVGIGKVTLIGLHRMEIEKELIEDEIKHSVYAVEKVILGTHIQDLEFKGAELHFPKLNEWLGEQPPRVDNITTPEDEVKVEIEDTEMEIKCCSMKNTVKSQIRYDQPGHRVEFNRKTWIELEPYEDEKLNLDELLKHVSTWSDFLSLCTGENISPNSIAVTVDSNSSSHTDFEKHSVLMHIQQFQSDAKPGILGAKTAQKDISEIFQNFEELRNEEAPYVMSVYFSLRKSDQNYPVQKFVHYFSALDSLLEKRDANKHVENKVHEELRDDLEQYMEKWRDRKLPQDMEYSGQNFDDLKDSIANAVRNHGNSKSMGEKAEELRSESEVFENHNITEERLTTMKKTRHQYVHISSNPSKNILDSDELPRACLQLRMMIEWEFLKLLDISKRYRDKQIEHFYMFNRDY